MQLLQLLKKMDTNLFSTSKSCYTLMTLKMSVAW